MTPLFYSRRQLLRMLHLTPRQLQRWQELGLFPAQSRYGWQDLLRARALRQYDAADIRPAVVADSLKAIGERVPALAADPIGRARVGVFAGRVELHYGGIFMDALSGQLRLPFETAATPPNPSINEPRPARPGATARRDEPSRQQRQHEEAEQWFGFGLSLEGDPELRDQAAAAYEQCLRLEPGFLSAHINLGTLRYHQKDFAAAERCYRAAVALDANYALAHFNLGNVLDETGRLAEAIAAYLAAVQLVPDYADAHYNLALAYQRQGQPRRAIPHWQQYLGIDKSSAWANHARAQLKQTLARDALQLVAAAKSPASY
ncbi:MAG: tetratricopeptide repeat protein [Terriglobales bacterium]